MQQGGLLLHHRPLSNPQLLLVALLQPHTHSYHKQ